MGSFLTISLRNNSKPISLSDFLMETSKSSKNTVSSKLRSGFIAVFSASNSCQRHRHESRDLPPSSSANTNYSYYILSSAHAPFISIQPPSLPLYSMNYGVKKVVITHLQLVSYFKKIGIQNSGS